MIIDYKMPDMNGIELIKWTKTFLRSEGVAEEDFPRFAFRAQQFWELLTPEKVNEIFDLGIKREDVLERITKSK